MGTSTVDTRLLQLLLIGAGEDVGPSGADGDEGAHTRDALAQYGRKHPEPKPEPIPAPKVLPGLVSAKMGHLEAGSVVHQAIIPASGLVAMVWHHTGGHLGAKGTLNVVNQRGLSVNYAIDRDGEMWMLADFLEVSYHAGVADKAPWSKLLGGGAANWHTIGCEVDALKDDDVLPAQVARAVRFAIDLHASFPNLFHIGHGELSSQKMWNEGLTIAQAIRGPDFKIKPELLLRAAA